MPFCVHCKDGCVLHLLIPSIFITYYHCMAWMLSCTIWLIGTSAEKGFVILTPRLIWHLSHKEHMLIVTGSQGSSFPHAPLVFPLVCSGTRGGPCKSACVPMTDYIFMQENKTRLSDGLLYL